MWLEGLYMAEPFYAEYAATFHHPEAFNDIARQFALIDEHARDAKTGLLYHGWDESKQARWADKETGDSQQFWARGMGWTMMALVDTLQYFPKTAPEEAVDRPIGAGCHGSVALSGWSDWTLVSGTREKRSQGKLFRVFRLLHVCLFTGQGGARGYLPQRYLETAERGYRGILSHFIQSGPGILCRLQAP